jgi:hypothetical protein
MAVVLIAGTVVAFCLAGWPLAKYRRRYNHKKAERVFQELRQEGYNVLSINSSATRVLVLRGQRKKWLDIAELKAPESPHAG